MLLNSSKDIMNILVESVDEALESIQIPFILRNDRTRISSGLVHRGKYFPLFTVQIEPFAVCDHPILCIAATNDVDVSVFELVVSCKTGPSDVDIPLLFNLSGLKIELENVIDRSSLA